MFNRDNRGFVDLNVILIDENGLNMPTEQTRLLKKIINSLIKGEM